ncbi:MAG: class I SAM-dependent methyltransferase, partial [Planctomycetes bacterium]|nr:class I SAM-dependent methyltransferase [Planctomycetota bacterium]
MMNLEPNLSTAVQDYWEDPATKSIIDINLHELEMGSVCRYLQAQDRLLDFGCGDGRATVRYAGQVRECVGVERSQFLREQALENAAGSGLTNIQIVEGDLLSPQESLGLYDVAVTQRMLINLISWEDQQRGLINIHRLLKPGGRYIMIENTNDGFSSLNDMRRAVGLSPIR